MAEIKDSWIDTGKSFCVAIHNLTKSVAKTTIAGADAIRSWANSDKQHVDCDAVEVLECPSCKTACPKNSRFCLHCGAKFE